LLHVPDCPLCHEIFSGDLDDFEVALGAFGAESGRLDRPPEEQAASVREPDWLVIAYLICGSGIELHVQS